MDVIPMGVKAPERRVVSSIPIYNSNGLPWSEFYRRISTAGSVTVRRRSRRIHHERTPEGFLTSGDVAE